MQILCPICHAAFLARLGTVSCSVASHCFYSDAREQSHPQDEAGEWPVRSSEVCLQCLAFIVLVLRAGGSEAQAVRLFEMCVPQYGIHF